MKTETKNLIVALEDLLESIEDERNKERDPYDDGWNDPPWEKSAEGKFSRALVEFIKASTPPP